MNYSKIDKMSIVDGVGCRVTLFVSGCRNHCKGCFNPDTWDFNFGQEFTTDTWKEIIDACNKDYIAGMTIVGGEPFEQENQEALLPFIEQFKKELPTKNIWIFTGYTLENDLVEGKRKYVPNVTNKILMMTDVLVDGPFILEKRDLTLKFRGSTNQRILYKNQIQDLM